jgi:hypothetical protein
MSELVINKEAGKGQIKDVVFAYVKMQTGAFKYQSTTEYEYCVDCIVDKATAKAYKKAFPKNGYREVETDEFKDKYKIDPIYPDEDEQFILKLKANANLSSDIPSCNLCAGDLVPYKFSTRPKAFVNVESGVEDITMTTLIANGSKGTVAFNITENSYGVFPKLTGILITDLIKYEQNEKDTPFGNLVGNFNPGDGNPQQVATQNTEEETVDGSQNPIPDDFDRLDVPF